MIAEQAKHLASAFWQGFGSGLSTRAVVFPPAEYITSLDATWTSQDVANNARATIADLSLVKLGDWLLSASGMRCLTLTIQLGSDSYECTFLAADAQAGYNSSIWSLGDAYGYLISCQFAMMGLPEAGTYITDFWLAESFADGVLSAKMDNSYVKITDSSITWTGEIGNFETVQMPFGDSTLTYVKISDTVPSTNLSDYTSISRLEDGAVITEDISDEALADESYPTLFKDIVDDSYISLRWLYAQIVFVDSAEISDGVTLTKGVWFISLDDANFTQKIEGNFANV